MHAHHLLIFTLCLWRYTHSPPPTFSHVSVCLQTCFSFCVFFTLRFYIYPPLPLNFFLSEALWFEQRQSSERQVSGLFTTESSSVLTALLILGSLWYFHLRWPHLGCQPHVTLPVGGIVHCEHSPERENVWAWVHVLRNIFTRILCGMWVSASLDVSHSAWAHAGDLPGDTAE